MGLALLFLRDITTVDVLPLKRACSQMMNDKHAPSRPNALSIRESHPFNSTIPCGPDRLTASVAYPARPVRPKRRNCFRRPSKVGVFLRKVKFDRVCRDSYAGGRRTTLGNRATADFLSGFSSSPFQRMARIGFSMTCLPVADSNRHPFHAVWIFSSLSVIKDRNQSKVASW